MKLPMHGAHALLLAAASLSTFLAEGPALAAKAAHAPLPILGSEGGPVLTTPRVVPVYYSADPLAGDLGAFYGRRAARPSRYLPSALLAGIRR